MIEDKQEAAGNTTITDFWGRRAPATVIGVLLFGILGSALYDFFIKPGINIFAETLFNLLTLGSQQVKDLSFNTAALDPTSIPSLTLLIEAATIAMLLPMNKTIQRKIRRNRQTRLNNDKINPRKVFFLKWIVLFPLLLGLTFVTLNIFNQAILTWRVFNANIAIIAPIASEETIKELKAKFASMRTELDYRAINIELKKIADSKKIQLRDEKPW
ncbi:MAG: hypothetical protein WC762_07720 [Methylobacter sp.]